MHDDSFARETIVKGVIDFPIDFSVGESLVSRYLHRETNKIKCTILCVLFLYEALNKPR